MEHNQGEWLNVMTQMAITDTQQMFMKFYRQEFVWVEGVEAGNSAVKILQQDITVAKNSKAPRGIIKEKVYLHLCEGEKFGAALSQKKKGRWQGGS